MPHVSDPVEMVRVSVRVPVETYNKYKAWIENVGLYAPHVWDVAFAKGMIELVTFFAGYDPSDMADHLDEAIKAHKKRMTLLRRRQFQAESLELEL